ncbi:MAG: signal peptidase II [Bacteroidota bacterium]
MKLRARLTLLGTIVAVVLAIDQITKRLAVEHLYGEPVVTLFGGFLKLLYAENEGAMLGLGGTLADETRFMLFVVMNAVLLGGLTIFLLTRSVLRRSEIIALALILGGGLGNLWDRIVNEGHVVVDFLLLTAFGRQITGVFNIADMAIMGGVITMLILSFFPPKEPEVEGNVFPADASETPEQVVLPRRPLDSTDDFLSRVAIAKLAEDCLEGRVPYSKFLDAVYEHPDPDIEELYDAVEHNEDEDARQLISRLRRSP